MATPSIQLNFKSDPQISGPFFLLKAERRNANTLFQSIEFFHFFIQKSIDVLRIDERRVQVAVAEKFARCRERDSNRNACCCKCMPRQMAMHMLIMP